MMLAGPAIGLALAAALSTLPAQADPIADFYASKDIKLLIASPPGGGYDAFARLFGRHLGRLLPGQPKVIPQNMPGGGGLVATNSIANQQPRDGLVIAAANGQMGTASLFGARGVRYDARQLGWIGSFNAEVGLSVARTDAAVKSAADLFRSELIVGASGANDSNVIYPTTMNRVLGTKFKIVPGYGGTAAVALAIERGEVQGTASWHYSSMRVAKPQWLKGQVINVILQLSLARHPNLPNIPTVLDLAKTDEQKQIIRLVFAQQDMGRPVFAPPGVPPERLAALRKAFDLFVKDKLVREEVDKLRLEINRPMRGEEISAMIEELHKLPNAVIEKAREVTRPDIPAKK